MSRIPAALTVVFATSYFLNCNDCLAKDAFKLPTCPAVAKEDKVAPSTPVIDSIGLRAPANHKAKPSTAIDQARKINAVPLALIQSEAELEKQGQLGLDSERRQLTDLWTATINRSEDIRFVLTALQPTSDAKHRASTTMKFVSGALFSATWLNSTKCRTPRVQRGVQQINFNSNTQSGDRAKTLERLSKGHYCTNYS